MPPKMLLESLVLKVGLLFVALFCVIAALIEPKPLNVVMSSINFIMAIVVCVVYGRDAYDALLQRIPTRGSVLALGIFVSWGAVAITRFASLLYRVTGDASLLDNYYTPFAILMSSLAGVLHLTAPHDLTLPQPKKAWFVIWITVIIGACTASFLLGVAQRY